MKKYYASILIGALAVATALAQPMLPSRFVAVEFNSTNDVKWILTNSITTNVLGKFPESKWVQEGDMIYSRESGNYTEHCDARSNTIVVITFKGRDTSVVIESVPIRWFKREVTVTVKTNETVKVTELPMLNTGGAATNSILYIK